MIELAQLSTACGIWNLIWKLVIQGYDFAVDSLLYSVIFVGKFLVAMIDLTSYIQSLLANVLKQIVLAPVIYTHKLCNCNRQFLKITVGLCNGYLSFTNKIFEVVLRFLRFFEFQLLRLLVALTIVTTVLVIRILNIIIWIVSKFSLLLSLLIDGYPVERKTIGETDEAPSSSLPEDAFSD